MFLCRAANRPWCTEPPLRCQDMQHEGDFFKEENKSRAVQQPLRAARNCTCNEADADRQVLQQGTISFVLFLVTNAAENKLNKSQRSSMAFLTSLCPPCPSSFSLFLPHIH